MKRVELGSRRITMRSIGELLVIEHRPYARKRLFALKMILKGATVGRVAMAARTTKATVEKWLRTVRRGGLELLLEAPAYAWIECRLSGREVIQLRAKIRKALSDGVNERLAERLTIMDRVLDEGDVDRVARTVRFAPDTLRVWLSGVR